MFNTIKKYKVSILWTLSRIIFISGVGLVEELPREKQFEYVEFTTIAETNNLGLAALAKSILDSEGIKYYTDDIQDYIARGTFLHKSKCQYGMM